MTCCHRTLLAWVVLTTVAGVARAEPRPAKPLKGDDAEAIDRMVLRKATAHPIRYFVSLPKNYARQPDLKWPLLVALPGMGEQFEEGAAAFNKARGDLPAILVVPVTLANNPTIDDRLLAKYQEFYDITNTVRTAAGEHYVGDNLPPPPKRLQWDEAGLLAILEDMRQECDAEERFYINGFSAGGFLTYQFVFTYPQALAAAVLVCTDFTDQDYRTNASQDRDVARNLPVFIIQGADDPLRYLPSATRRQRLKYFIVSLIALAGLAGVVFYLTRRRRLALAVILVGALAAGILIEVRVTNEAVDNDNDEAERILRDLGYEQIHRTIVPGVGHDPSEMLVIETLRPYWKRP